MGALAIELHHIAIALNAVVLAVAAFFIIAIVRTELQERRAAVSSRAGSDRDRAAGGRDD
jgi:hypothetical protein